MSPWWLDFVGYVATVVVGVVGIGLTVIGLPGLWLMWGVALVYAWLTGWLHLSWPGLLAMLVLAILSEVAEFVAGAAGGKAAGGGWRSMVGAVVGGLIGAIAGSFLIPIPVVGTIAGAILGSGVGAAGLEATVERDHVKLADIAWGAGVGRAWGIVIKALFGVAMLGVLLVAGWPGAVGPAAPMLPNEPAEILPDTTEVPAEAESLPEVLSPPADGDSAGAADAP